MTTNKTIHTDQYLAQRPLRVLYFIGSYGPDVMGNASHEETVVALRARGHEVDVLTQITKPGVPLYSRAQFAGVPVYQVNLAASGGRLAGLVRKGAGRFMRYEYLGTLLSAYRRHLSKHKYDLVHVEGAYPFGFVAAMGSGRTPYMANVQGADVIALPEYDYGYRRFRWPRLAVAYALKRAALVRVISPLLGDYLQQERLAAPNKVVVILRAIEASAFPPPNTSLVDLRLEARRMLADKYGIGLDRPVIMTLSRLHPFKGLEYLVDAMKIIAEGRRRIPYSVFRIPYSAPLNESPHLRASALNLSSAIQNRGALWATGRALGHQNPKSGELPWLVIGGPSRSTEHYGDYREFLQRRAEEAGISDYVVFTGQVEHAQVRQHLAGADIFVCPSILEAQNKVVPEAAAVGTPSVVTETTGIASYFAPEHACVSVPPASAEALAEAILRLLDDQEYYAAVCENALRMTDTLRAEAIAPQVEAAWYRAAGVS